MSIPITTRRLGRGEVGRIPWSELGGVRVGAVLWGGLALVDAGRVTGAPSYVVLAAIALLVTAASVGMPTTTAAAVALTGWLLVNGFLEHRYGVLGFAGTPDLARLGLLAALALTATRARS